MSISIFQSSEKVQCKEILFTFIECIVSQTHLNRGTCFMPNLIKSHKTKCSVKQASGHWSGRVA